MKSRQFNKAEAKINITPMLDVVFIILIFFIVSTWAEIEMGIDTVRPSCPPVRYVKKGHILVKVKASGAVLINQQSTILSQLLNHIKALHAEFPGANAIIIAEHNSQTGDLLKVMGHLKTAGVNQISIASNHK